MLTACLVAGIISCLGTSIGAFCEACDSQGAKCMVLTIIALVAGVTVFGLWACVEVVNRT